MVLLMPALSEPAAGSLVLSGGLTAPVKLQPGEVVSVEFDGLGSVEIYG